MFWDLELATAEKAIRVKEYHSGHEGAGVLLVLDQQCVACCRSNRIHALQMEHVSTQRRNK